MTARQDLDLLPVLKQYFGFDSFLPLQEEIIRDTLAGRDVLALLPTGGGKSLCFQLPALVRRGLTVVVSPLIALMKDQVDGLQAAGVPATFLNSSLEPGESRLRLRGLRNGEYKLLYVAPERLMLPDFLAELRDWNVALFAIDEAHCISEWGHDFRPEYRQLRELRAAFPDAPLMALTATATERVREDIVGLLRLRDPKRYVASFNRPNLTYRVTAKRRPFEQLLALLQSQPNESGIVYCQSRKGAESLAERLEANGVRALPYHAGMTAEDRTRNQEAFIRDEVQVICATIAFGMGINKPNVRFVVHYDLPRNVEGYYQETGRAGRDGLPSECLLFFSPADPVKLSRFVEEKLDPRERQVGREQLQQMVQYAEGSSCRRAELLRYFGEDYPDEGCGGCDNCLSPRETFDGTIEAQKLLSCVYRIRQKSGIGVGMGHVVAVLTGGDTEQVRRWGHQDLSTYGIGRDRSRAEWSAIGRELVRLGYLRQTPDRFSVLELTEEGLAVLRERRPVTLTRPVAGPEPSPEGRQGPSYDLVLFDRLRGLRKRLADQRGVPAYIVLSDVSLRQMARDYPSTMEEMGRISGVGQEKLRVFGRPFLTEVAEHLKEHSRQEFRDTEAMPVPVVAKRPVGESIRETLRLFQEGLSVEEIAQERHLAAGTIYGHIATAIEGGEAAVDPARFFTPEERVRLAGVFSGADPGATLTDLRAQTGEEFDFNRLRLFRALWRQGVR
jgi:ATP-dependent DNA helicase RecQ